MPDQDYYTTLGIPPNAPDEDIRRAFRRMAMEYHPDRNKTPGAEDKFKEINEAYQVLSDPKKRAQYDRFGKAGVGAAGPSGPSGPGGANPFDGFDVFGGFGDIFDSFFGDASARSARQPRRGNDLQHHITLAFEDAAFGASRQVEIQRLEPCPRCSGAGNEPGTPINPCAPCRGNGQVRRYQRSVFGQFTQVAPCPTCRGRGNTIPSPCSACRASGQQRRKRKIEVQIPAGIDTGMQLRLSNEGDAGSHGGPPGNLYVSIEIREHPFFRRDGANILYTLPLNLAEAALGADKPIPTIDGFEETFPVPQGTQPGTPFTLRGKGIPQLNSNRRGDMTILADVRIPNSLNPRQRELLEELALSLNGQNPKNRPNDPKSKTKTKPDAKAENKNARKKRPKKDAPPDPTPQTAASTPDAPEKGLFDRIKDAF